MNMKNIIKPIDFKIKEAVIEECIVRYDKEHYYLKMIFKMGYIIEEYNKIYFANPNGLENYTKLSFNVNSVSECKGKKVILIYTPLEGDTFMIINQENEKFFSLQINFFSHLYLKYLKNIMIKKEFYFLNNLDTPHQLALGFLKEVVDNNNKSENSVLLAKTILQKHIDHYNLKKKINQLKNHNEYKHYEINKI